MASVKALQNNVIEKDLQSIVKPLNLMLNVFFCKKYSLHNNIISCNTRAYNFAKVLATFLLRCFCAYNIMSYISYFQSNWWGIHSIFYIFSACFEFSFHVMADFINGYFDMKHTYYISLILRIQYVLKVLEINANDIRHLVISNWVFVMILNVYYIAFDISYFTIFNRYSMCDIISSYVTVTYDIGILYALFVLKLVEQVLRVWMAKVWQSTENRSYRPDEYWKRLLDVYFVVHEICTILGKTFQEMIVLYTVYTAYLSLRNVALVLCLRDNIFSGNRKYLVVPLVSQIWSVKNIILIIYLTVKCESFYAAMRDVQSTCVLLMNSSQCSVAERRLYKKVFLLQRSSCKKLRACCLFTVSAELSLKLFSFITSYTIILLQFAYLNS